MQSSHFSPEHNNERHCKGVLFTYYLRTVRELTKLVTFTKLRLTSLLKTRLPLYSRFCYLLTRTQVGVRSYGTQLAPSTLMRASDQRLTIQL